MLEEKLVKARAAAELEAEPLFRIIKQTLIEVYMKGFMNGLTCFDENRQSTQLSESPTDDGPMVMLKPDAILKRRLRRDEFPLRVWRTLENLNIETLGDILQVSETFYLSQPHFGKGSLNVLRNYVKKFGYKLKEN